jgi:mannose-6-phosphate isomerase-like protein (cupin superfamily)
MTDTGIFNISSNRNYVLFGVRMRILLTPAQTGDQFGLVEGIMPAGTDAGLHVHHREDETMVIIEGSLEVTIGSETRLLMAGDSYFAPRAVPHRLRNTGAGPMRSLMIATPGEFTSFVTEAGVAFSGDDMPAPTPPTAEDFQTVGVLMEAHGLGMVFPSAS